MSNYLIIDTRNLYEASKEDYEGERWSSYPDYIDEYNRIAQKVEERQVANLKEDGLDKIDSVPEEQRGAYRHMGSSAEQAKLREIVNKSKRLLERLELVK